MGPDCLTDNSTWFQIDNYGPWVLEDSVDMVYNKLVAYPSHFFHNPYINRMWSEIDTYYLIEDPNLK